MKASQFFKYASTPRPTIVAGGVGGGKLGGGEGVPTGAGGGDIFGDGDGLRLGGGEGIGGFG